MNIQAPVATPTVGHNRAPFYERIALLNDELPGLLADETTDLAARRDELLEAFAKSPEVIADDEAAKPVADLGKAMRTFAVGPTSTCETRRKAANEPFSTGKAIVDGHFKEQLASKVAAGVDTLRQRYDDFLARKEAAARKVAEEAAQRAAAEAEAARKRAAEEAEAARLEAEVMGAPQAAPSGATAEFVQDAEVRADAAAAAVHAKSADLVRVRSDLGTVATRTTNWTGEVEDKAALLESAKDLWPFFTVDDLNKVVRAYVKANKPAPGAAAPVLKGAKIYPAKNTSFR